MAIFSQPQPPYYSPEVLDDGALAVFVIFVGMPAVGLAIVTCFVARIPLQSGEGQGQLERQPCKVFSIGEGGFRFASVFLVCMIAYLGDLLPPYSVVFPRTLRPVVRLRRGLGQKPGRDVWIHRCAAWPDLG